RSAQAVKACFQGALLGLEIVRWHPDILILAAGNIMQVATIESGSPRDHADWRIFRTDRIADPPSPQFVRPSAARPACPDHARESSPSRPCWDLRNNCSSLKRE